MDNDNIIVLKQRSIDENRASISVRSTKFQSVLASGALATTLFFVTIMNFVLSSQNETRESRSIASVAPLVDSEISNWDKTILKRLAEKSDRKMASISSHATDLDQLRFGLLEGKYAIKLEDGKISEINFHEAEQDADRPKYIKSKEEFLAEYRMLIKGDYTAASRLDEKIDSGNIVESFQLIGPKSGPVGIARFTSDQFGRLISLRIDK